MINERIKQLRTDKGIMQNHMADRLGIHRATYHRIENGKSKIDANLLPRVAELLGVDVQELIRNDKEE